MALSASRTGGLGIALLLAGNAFALGLGEVAGQATLGQPLRLEIPILGADGKAPAASCFRLRAPRTDIGNDFAARHGRVSVASERGGNRLVISSATAVHEPVIGFAVAADCGFGLSKDYVVLVGMPATAPAAPAVEAPGVAAPAAAKPAEPASAKPLEAPAPAPPLSARPAVAASEDAPAADILRVDAAVTLEALARQKYPLQPKAREKFMRMMIQANSALAGSDAPIAAGTELRLPPGLPVRRVGPYLGESRAAPAAKTASSAQPAPDVALPTAKPDARSSRKDRLMLSAVPETNEARMLEEAERLANILVEQNKSQEVLIANLASLEGSYGELRTQFVQMQERLARIEAERAAEKQAAKSFGFVELFAAVLAGGLVGGVALNYFQRARTRREPIAADPVPLQPAAAPQADPELPWAPQSAPATAATNEIPERIMIAATAAAAQPIVESTTTQPFVAARAAAEARAEETDRDEQNVLDFRL